MLSFWVIWWVWFLSRSEIMDDNGAAFMALFDFSEGQYFQMESIMFYALHSSVKWMSWMTCVKLLASLASHNGVIMSTCWSPTLVFWIWRLPCSCRENRRSFPSRLMPFFLQVTEGSGSPDAWHLNRAVPPTACVWLDGPCLMMGGGRSFRAEDNN